MAGITVEQRSARVEGGRVFYLQAGSGEAVVLLHGLSGSSRWWKKNLRALAGRFRVYAVDLIGFGRSRGQRFVLEDAAGIIGQWMEAVGEARFNLVGHSLGGLVAVEVAARQPERISGLVLVDAAALPMGHTIWRSLVNLLRALRTIPLDFLPVLAADALRAGPLTLLSASRAVHQADITADLRRVAARTLIVWGEHDRLLEAERGADLHRRLPGSELVVLRGAGHNPMWDRPEAFNRAVLEFLERK